MRIRPPPGFAQNILASELKANREVLYISSRIGTAYTVSPAHADWQGGCYGPCDVRLDGLAGWYHRC